MLTQSINEKSSALYLATLKDRGVLVPGASLTSLVLTLYSAIDGSIVNGRNAQNVLNANGVTVYDTLQSMTVDGVVYTYNLAWEISVLDTAILGSGKVEAHIAEFHATWSAGAKGLTHRVELDIVNFTKTT